VAALSHASKTIASSLLAAVSALALVSCGGARAFAPGTNGQAGSANRYVSPRALQQNNGAQFVEFGTACSVALGQLSHDTTGVSMWFTAAHGCKKGSPGEVGTVGIATGTINEFVLPKDSKPLAITENAGYVWVADTFKRKTGRSMYRFNENGTYSTFALPDAFDVSDMTAGPDGNVWFVGSYTQGKEFAGVGYMTPTGSAVLYEVSSKTTPVLTSIASGADGNLWLTDEKNGAIIKVAPSNGAETPYPVGGNPLSITNSTKALIYSDASAAQLSVITTDGVSTVYPAPKGQHPGFIARKSDGTVVYIDTSNNSDAVGTFSPSSGTYAAEAQAPNGELSYLYNGPDGNMWFTDGLGHVGAYLQHILTTNPSSISLSQTVCSAHFTVSEPGYSGNFSVASQNTVIATVSPASGNAGTTFTVMPLEGGSTSLSVQDSLQNVVGIAVTVEPGCTSPAIFNYLGAQQNFTVPAGVTQLTVDAYGAAGGAGGGYVQATIPVTPGESLAVLVGGAGAGGVVGGGGGAGGFNGGGVGGPAGGPHFGYSGAGGGGASDVRQGGAGLANRIVVAGGAGGNGDYAGGAGGGSSGAAGSGGGYSGYYGTDGGGGGGGTQTGGGAAGSGGQYRGLCDNAGSGAPGTLAVGGAGGYGGNGQLYCYGASGGGGGGGGYYGGGGGGGAATGGSSGGGGGGSSFIEPNATGVTNTQGGSNAAQIILSWTQGTSARARRATTK
jgi:streptogramin lyase